MFWRFSIMASILKVNTLTGASTAGSIAVTGEGNSTTTNLQQGLCKVWVNMNAGETANDSQNVSGLTDVGTGAHTISFSNNMANANYSPSMNGKESVGGTHASDGVDRLLNPTRVVYTTSDIKVTAINFSNQLRDLHTNTVNIMGDLA